MIQIASEQPKTCGSEGSGQLSASAQEELEKQAYRIVGRHSAVKTCGWTKNMIRGEGGCYKLKFYGIMSHQCMQMTTSISCANRCTFCWRGYKAPVAKEWKWGVDDPEFILENSLEAHHDLIVGFKGGKKTNEKLFEGSQEVKHVALSLTGEPITYPRINELLDLFNQKGISTFLVTNAQYPEQIKNLKPVTQLYESLDAPNKELLKEIDKPLFIDFWERANQSLDYLKEKKQRTCIRLTIIKGVNDVEPENYAKLILKGMPDFIEVKAYMWVGASRERLNKANMPLHEEVIDFTKKLIQYLPDYDIVSEHIPSRVIMCAKKKFFKNGRWHTWIDFPKYHELVNSGKEFVTADYLKPTPSTGLSGKGTIDRRKEWEEIKLEKKEKQNEEKQNKEKESQEVYVNETMPELDFWQKKEEQTTEQNTEQKPPGGC
ncbi:4-demethylwyosine synthase TYW1 [Candidatus Woesearchaeota archaeon]|nr:4-demethylwyosine synthase TYW1 [Candidatus Woesearchaeota archaeon]